MSEKSWFWWGAFDQAFCRTNCDEFSRRSRCGILKVGIQKVNEISFKVLLPWKHRTMTRDLIQLNYGMGSIKKTKHSIERKGRWQLTMQKKQTSFNSSLVAVIEEVR